MRRHSWTNNGSPLFSVLASPAVTNYGVLSDMVDILAAPQQAKADNSLRTLAAILVAHWVSHFHLLCCRCCFRS